ncbi:hypothetical protein O0444_25370 [Pseudomonas aeruginosa PAO1]|uniref:hypothetical protein n=1 Tax=Pseudomonas aeruginosa TaxID=287 RepID=UPI001F3931FC|nr:hypothetical protein [Pseudomonas aeruginosa]UVS72741.1 hypothetical protein NX763_25355 [Pseudomonas aeruginosa]UXN40229.1 hypothetical protein N2X48_25370 [Pseudomonas aeruginosa]
MQQVIAVSLCATHAFSKQVRPAIRLLKGLGVEGDAHHGVTVKHRSRVRQDPTQPNLRQVHLIHEELHDELRASASPSARGPWARTSPPVASTCSACPPAPACAWGKAPWSS